MSLFEYGVDFCGDYRKVTVASFESLCMYVCIEILFVKQYIETI